MFEPGPMQLEALPLGPRVVDDGTFGALRAEIADSIPGAEGGLDAIKGVVGAPLPLDLGEEFAHTIAGAEDAYAAEPDEGTFSPAGEAANAGDHVEGLRLDVTPHLPPVDAPIDLPVDEPPEPPGGSGEFPYGDLPPLDPGTGCPVGWDIVDRDYCSDPNDASRLVPRQPTA